MVCMILWFESSLHWCQMFDIGSNHMMINFEVKRFEWKGVLSEPSSSASHLVFRSMIERRPYGDFLWLSLEWFGFPSCFAGISLRFPSQSLSFLHVCKSFPRISFFWFPPRFAGVSLEFPSKGLSFSHVLQGFLSPLQRLSFCSKFFFLRPAL